jgi:hypothetical protein
MGDTASSFTISKLCDASNNHLLNKKNNKIQKEQAYGWSLNSSKIGFIFLPSSISPPSPILPEHSSSSLFFATGINETWAETGFRAIKHAHNTGIRQLTTTEAKGSRVPALFGIMPG